MHPELGKNIYSQTAVCYLRFPGKVRVDHLELPIENTRFTSGRWVPLVPTHPAHIIVSTLDGNGNRWKTIKEIELPRNPKFAGEGLSQEMSMEETEEFFSRAVAEKPSHIIELGGTETICLKVECDREYPGWPNHGECNGGPFNVPFGIFARLSAFGEELENDDLPPYHKKLEKTVFAPSAPEGMKINERNPLEIVFEGKKLSVGFSLIRPMLTHLAWDCSGKGNTSQNRLLFTAYGGYGGCGGNGPHYITANKNFDAQNMTGKVSVEGNQVRYHDIETGCGITLNATFTVNAESITLELEQNAARDIPVIEGEAWRLLWNMRAGLTSVSGIPTVKEGRNGFVDLPALIVGDEGGCLSCRLLEGNGAFHTESYREIEMRSIGFIMSAPDTVNTSMLIPKGVSRTVFELKPSNLVPVQQGKEAELSGGLKNSWAAGFSAFRPEHGGFSNNAISANCHVNQWVAFDFAAFTAKADNGLDLKELVKFSIGRALMDGGGYGYHRSLYLDSDPMLLSGAGRIFQLTEDKEWLEYVRPGIAAAASRIIDNFDDKEGMIVCRALSGNSSSYRWSTNSMDVIGFGHIDAYVNAWSFRAMKNAAVVLKALGDDSLAANCREVAAALSENYAKQLVNPETGWVSGWKSRDGKLHDFGFLWVNAVACAFDVMGQAETAHAIGKLEAKRQELFPESGYLGLPLNLIPIKETDHMRVQINNHYRFVPSYENYTDGALSPVGVVYYIRALSSHGFKKEAGKIAESIEQGFEDGKFHGPSGTGKEFMTWTGADSGYEGTFGPNSGPLYAVAVERGIIVPPSPEWWPAD
jgi:hypothetical protein